MHTSLLVALLAFGPLLFALLLLYRTLSLPQHGMSLDQGLAYRPEQYRPLERLLLERDFRFLAAQPGFSPQLGQRFKRQRQVVVRGYLRNMKKDFNRLSGLVQTLIVHATEDRGDLALALIRQRLLFALAMLLVEARLLFAPGCCALDVRSMMKALETMQLQIRLLVLTPEAATI